MKIAAKRLSVCLAFLCFLCTLCTLNLADAQRLRFRSSGLVTFAPTSEVYLTALGGTLEPESSSPDVRMRVDKSRRFTLSVEPTPRPSGAPELQARYTFTTKRDGTTVTPWLPLNAPFQSTFSNIDRRMDVSVAYRVRLTGQEVAGSYTVALTYRANDSSVRHEVRVVIPTATALRLDTSLVTAQNALLDFDYGGANLKAYLRAVEARSPLSATADNFRALEVFSNHPRGYTVTVEVAQQDISPGGDTLADRLYLAGQPARGRRFVSTSPTYGFEPLISPDDFALRVDGLEDPGRYTFRLTYDARANP